MAALFTRLPVALEYRSTLLSRLGFRPVCIQANLPREAKNIRHKFAQVLIQVDLSAYKEICSKIVIWITLIKVQMIVHLNEQQKNGGK